MNLKISHYIGHCTVALLFYLLVGCADRIPSNEHVQKDLSYRTVPLLTFGHLRFKDMNRNGQLDAYEDWRLPPSKRVADLVSRMTLAEKAGAMMHANPSTLSESTIPGAGSRWDFKKVNELVLKKHITFFLNRLSASARDLAEQHNLLQSVAEQGRLAIPVSLSTDPRSQFGASQGISSRAVDFTQWPDPTGFAAINDTELVRQFADSVRQEYLAVGIRIALSPQADLTINPQWHRTNGTFGSDPYRAKRLVSGYVQGMQAGNDGINDKSVVAVVKHWVGYGATQQEGYDAHNYYGRQLELTANEIEQHFIPFVGAFSAKVGAVMPAYGLLPENIVVAGSKGPIEHVGMGFNRQMLHDVLRGRFGFDGVIMSDWHITDDCSAVCLRGAADGEQPGKHDIGMPWGVANLSKAERFAKAIKAGVNQFGGVETPEIIVRLVNEGKVDISYIDSSVKNILLQKFQQGLFESPYVNVDKAEKVVGNETFKALALNAQRRSMVLIKNANKTLPLVNPSLTKIFIYNIDRKAVESRGFIVVNSPEEADYAIVNLSTPYQKLHPNFFFGRRYREGSTGFSDGDKDYEALKNISAKVPTIVTYYFERPADLTAVADKSVAIIGYFGLSQDVLLEAIAGVVSPTATLPYDLPWLGTVPENMALKMGQGLVF